MCFFPPLEEGKPNIDFSFLFFFLSFFYIIIFASFSTLLPCFYFFFGQISFNNKNSIFLYFHFLSLNEGFFPFLFIYLLFILKLTFLLDYTLEIIIFKFTTVVLLTHIGVNNTLFLFFCFIIIL